jgi:hypothetical protein
MFASIAHHFFDDSRVTFIIQLLVNVSKTSSIDKIIQYQLHLCQTASCLLLSGRPGIGSQQVQKFLSEPPPALGPTQPFFAGASPA